MAAFDLVATLDRIQEDLYKTSEDYRKHVSNKKAHFITLNPNKIKTQVKREMENRGAYGFNKLPPEINEVINTEVVSGSFIIGLTEATLYGFN